MGSFLAAAPLVTVLGLMIVLRWQAAHAGLAALCLACLIAIAAFGLGTTTIATFGPAGALSGALLEALFTACTILWIVFPALAIYELQNRSGALHTLREAVSQVSSAPRTQVILIAWFFGLFLEGVAGFGTPVALTAPLLVGLGFTPVRAVALALIGHAAGVSFGALGTPLLAQAALTSVPASEIARETAMLHGLLGWSLLACLVWLAGDKRPTASEWGVAALAALCFFIPFLALAWWTGPELPTAGAGLIGGVCFAAISRGRQRASAAVSARAIAMAAFSYLVIVVLVLVTRLVPPISQSLRAAEVSWSLGGAFTGAFQPFYHPGILLALGFVLGAIAQGRPLSDLAVAAGAATSRLVPVAMALFAMLALSRVMVHAGMIGELANAAAGAAGLWPMLSPLVGVLGTFVTGSATASNILLTPFQSATASALDLPASRMLAAQGFGAAVGNIICPHNIIAGGATVGLKGDEGEVLRQVIGACMLYAVAGGLLLLWLVR